MGVIKTVGVRKAIRSERDSILDLCKLNHEENGQFALSMPRVETMIDRAFTPDGGCVVGIVGEDRVEGFILLMLSQFWYTDDWCMEEVMNYVHPDFRRSTHAKDMIQFSKRCADEIGIPLVIGVVSNERTQAKLALYKRQLGDPSGGYFIFRPKQSFVPDMTSLPG